MDKSTYEKHLVQPLQTKNKQFKRALTFLTGYNCIFNVTNSNHKICFAKSITDEAGFIQVSIPPGAYEKESLNKEFKGISIEGAHFTEANYPFPNTPNF